MLLTSPCMVWRLGGVRVVSFSPCPASFIVIGPHWRLLLVTLLAVMLPPVLCGALITSFHSSGEAWVLAASTLITLGLLCKTALADPGIVALSKGVGGARVLAPGECASDAEDCGEELFCAECDAAQPDTARHCDSCGVCIDGYDHHCPWVGICIGRLNARAFHAFFIAVAFHFTACIVVATG